MIRFERILSIAAATAVAACAAQEQQADSEAYKAPVYRTGSNLPAGRETGQSGQEMAAAERKVLEDCRTARGSRSA